MPMNIYLPLNGFGHEKPKAPAVSGWASPDYQGVPWPSEGEWVGRRTDGLVVVDCDSADALKRWVAVARDGMDTQIVRTPRGWHLYYRWDGKPLGPRSGVLGPGVDIRSGPGAYVVAPPTPGYEIIAGEDSVPETWNPAWLTEEDRSKHTPLMEGWSSIPEGMRNDILFRIGCDLRGRGMDEVTIRRILLGMNDVIVVPPLDKNDISRIAHQAAGYPPGIEVVIASTSEPEQAAGRPHSLSLKQQELQDPPAWLLKPYFLDAIATMLEGREGIGKGLFCAHLATQVTGGNLEGPAKPVLWFAYEDDIARDLLPRMYAAGWTPETHEDIIFVDPDHEFHLPRHAALLHNEIEAGKYGLVIFDPVKSYAGPVEGMEINSNSDIYVRKVFQPVSRAAMKQGVPVITVGHWKKGDGATGDRSLGSVAWRAIPRAVVQMAWSGDSEHGEGAFWLSKCNVASTGHLRSYRIEPIQMDVGDKHVESARFVMGAPIEEHETLDDWIDAHNEKKKGFTTGTAPTLRWGTDNVVEFMHLMYRPGVAIPPQPKMRAIASAAMIKALGPGTKEIPRDTWREMTKEMVKRGELVMDGQRYRMAR